MNSDNHVRLTYAIGIDLQFHAYFEDNQFKGIDISFKTPNGDIAARKCDDKMTYEFMKNRAIRDYNKQLK